MYWSICRISLCLQSIAAGMKQAEMSVEGAAIDHTHPGSHVSSRCKVCRCRRKLTRVPGQLHRLSWVSASRCCVRAPRWQVELGKGHNSSTSTSGCPLKCRRALSKSCASSLSRTVVSSPSRMARLRCNEHHRVLHMRCSRVVSNICQLTA